MQIWKNLDDQQLAMKSSPRVKTNLMILMQGDSIAMNVDEQIAFNQLDRDEEAV